MDVTDAEKALQGNQYLPVTMVGFELKLYKSKTLSKWGRYYIGMYDQ